MLNKKYEIYMAELIYQKIKIEHSWLAEDSRNSKEYKPFLFELYFFPEEADLLEKIIKEFINKNENPEIPNSE